ncbi:MAG TPA: TerB family tellurite resistance protein [Candidatus Limnocylindrales bacterium]|jgi:uncharacterized tellurite resistance protein B-like protein|nr:TerB family tellurite resistance protein [Candidatus Limnocylindrales bacterium]
MSYLRFLRPGAREGSAPTGQETAAIRAISARLEQMDPHRAAFLAGFAYLLGRVAYADLHISADETVEMERIVRDFGGLDEPTAVLIVEIAKSQARLEGATEDFLVARRFAEISTDDERERLMHCLFAVASAAGDVITADESHEIRQIAETLGYTLAELNVFRRRYADRLAALRRPSGEVSRASDPPG